MQAGYNFLCGGLMAEVLVEIEDLTSKKPGPTLTRNPFDLKGEDKAYAPQRGRGFAMMVENDSERKTEQVEKRLQLSGV